MADGNNDRLNIIRRSEVSRELTLDLGVEVARVLLEMARAHIRTSEMQANIQAGWEATRQKIAVLDAETRAVLARLEPDLRRARAKTEVMQLLIEALRSLRDAPPHITAGINLALDNLTKEF